MQALRKSQTVALSARALAIMLCSGSSLPAMLQTYGCIEALCTSLLILLE
jgi:hypothetical protein